MRKFLKELLIFLLPIFVIAVAAEVMLRRIPNNYKLKRSYLDKNSNQVQTLVLGNSHFFYGINPEFIHSKCFNAGNVSQDLEYDILILKKYDKQWKSLSRVIIPVDYFSLYSSLETGGESWRKNYYKLYFEIDNSQFADRFDIFNDNLNGSMRKLLNYYRYKIKDVNSNALGWGTAYSSAKNKDLQVTGFAAAKRHTMKDSQYLPVGINSLVSLIRYVKSKNVEVILITAPTFKNYYENLDQVQLRRTIMETEKIAKAFHVKYVNMLKDTSFKKNDFYDADHLNEIGAKKFSQKVDSLIMFNTLSAKMLTARPTSQRDLLP